MNEQVLLRGIPQSWHVSMDMRGWFPVSLANDVDGGTVIWRYLGQQALQESFFVDSLMMQEAAHRRVCQTPLLALDQLSDMLPPTAFIFHVSRCGSTLLCQLLNTLSSCIVMSEPPVIDSLLRFQYEQNLSVADRVLSLRKIISALGQKRSENEQHFFIKFDSWHIHHLSLFQQAFPETPCLFLYREPLTVLASHQRQRGPQMVPGMLHPQVLPVSPDAFSGGDIDAYSARVLLGFFQSALHSTSRLQLLNYAQLPDAVWSELLPKFDISYSQQQYLALQQRATFHSKKGALRFCGDPTMPDSVPQRSCALLQALLDAYQELEATRQY